MFLGIKVTNGICVDTRAGLEWIPKVMISAVNVVVFGPLLVMVALTQEWCTPYGSKSTMGIKSAINKK